MMTNSSNKSANLVMNSRSYIDATILVIVVALCLQSMCVGAIVEQIMKM
jgi:hypothetical protein